jgi:hypothetical protein
VTWLQNIGGFTSPPRDRIAVSSHSSRSGNSFSAYAPAQRNASGAPATDGPDQLLHVHVLRELGRSLVHDLAESVRVIVGHVHFQRRVETPDGDDKDDEEKQRLSESSQESTQRSRKLYAPLKKSLLDGSRLHVVVAPEDFAHSGDGEMHRGVVGHCLFRKSVGE